MKKTFVIAEIGINHNGSMEIVKQMIDIAKSSDADAVKFQKRKVDMVYDPITLRTERPSPWGRSYKEQKEGLELTVDQYYEIDEYCKTKGIEWFVSCWDPESQKTMRQFDLKYNKVASPMLTVLPLLEEIASEKKHTFISTGMSTLEEVTTAVNIFRKHGCSFELMHCVSAYPLENSDANLSMIKVLRDKFSCDVGYSGHERGLQVSLAAVALGATSLERHLTLDRTMYGSDQSASLEPDGFKKLVRDVRIIDVAIGNGVKTISDVEMSSREKLSRPYWYE